MANDLLYDCALAYSKLLDTQFKFTLSSPKEIVEATINFDESQFRHLAGLHKLSDISVISSENLSSSKLYNKILNLDITYDDISNSAFFNVPMNDATTNSTITPYYISDRLAALTHLYDYFHNFDIDKVGIFSWLKDGLKTMRPHYSDISADILISFDDTVNKKVPSEQVCSFFIEASSKSEFNGVTLFPSDKPYSYDDRISLSQYTILSVQEICKSTGITTDLYNAPAAEKEKAYNKVEVADRNKTIANDIKSLKRKRNKVIENPSVGNQNKYDKQLAIFKNRNIYTADMVKEVINRLNDQLSAAPNDKVADMIKSEIKFLQDQLIDRQQNPQHQLKEISISTVQMNGDSTLSVNNIATLSVPKAVTEVPKLVQRKTHTLTGTIKSFLSDVSDSIRKALVPKSHTEAHRASQSKSNGNSPKKTKVAENTHPVAPAERSVHEQEERSSVVDQIKELQAAQDKHTQAHQRTKSKSNDIEI